MLLKLIKICRQWFMPKYFDRAVCSTDSFQASHSAVDLLLCLVILYDPISDGLTFDLVSSMMPRCCGWKTSQFITPPACLTVGRRRLCGVWFLPLLLSHGNPSKQTTVAQCFCNSTLMNFKMLRPE